jgi:hypothetical protein
VAAVVGPSREGRARWALRGDAAAPLVIRPDWLEKALEPEQFTHAERLGAAIVLRLRLRLRIENTTAQASIMFASSRNIDRALDVVDAVLFFSSGARSGVLKSILSMGASVWTVSEDGRALVRRVRNEELVAYEMAIDPDDEISDELREAWMKITSRDGSPSRCTGRRPGRPRRRG